MIFVFGKLGLIDLEIFEIKKSSIKISDSNIFPRHGTVGQEVG